MINDINHDKWFLHFHCTLLMEAIQTDPTDPDALFNRGNQLDDEGRYDEAIEAYRQSASISGEQGALLE